jgi:hypothetical protein
MTQSGNFWIHPRRSLGGPENLSWRGGEEKNSQPPPALEPPINQPVAQRHTTKLSLEETT